MPPPGLELFADLYEFRMAQAYRALGMTETATFSLFVRRLPPTRNFLLACGVEDLLDMLEGLRFGAESLAWLRSLHEFPEDFLAWLAALRFSGTVHAVAEGTPLFAEEPLLEVTAPIAQAQMLETLAMNVVGSQTLLASKAARVVLAAAGRPVVDFGARRAQGVDAAVAGARAFHLAGVAATSNVLAGARHGVPVAGTMAHSFVQAFPSEAEALRAFTACHPETILLVDTYDTAEGVRRVVALAREMGAAFRVRGVRLDSGDLLALSRQARAMLDEAGLRHVQIFASGGLDEHRIAALLAAGAPIDAFGVGTEMSVSADAPALDIAYKLVAYAGEGRMKLSAGKRTLPGRKQVYRGAAGDTLALAEESLAGEPLLRPVMRDGRRLAPRPALAEARRAAAARIAALPEALRGLQPAPASWPVTVSPALERHAREVRARIDAEAAGGSG